MNYTNFNNYGKTFVGNQTRTEIERLPAGIYELGYDGQRDIVLFNKITTNYDTLLDLPSPEFNHVVGELTLFLDPASKQRFIDYGYLYKRSTLLHGIPGTGKTCLVNRIAEEVVKKDGIVIFNPNPQVLLKAYKVLEDIQPEVKVMVIFEELDQLAKRHEDDLLHILDGEVQKENIIYMATTNYLDQVPRRLCRPGRFPTILKVNLPGESARRFYLETKLLPEDRHEIEAWVKKSEGLSIDELKETVLAVKCLLQPLDSVLAKIRNVEQTKEVKEESNYSAQKVEEELEVFEYRDKGPFDEVLMKADHAKEEKS